MPAPPAPAEVRRLWLRVMNSAMPGYPPMRPIVARVVAAMQAAPAGASRDELARLLPREATRADLREAAAVLRQHGQRAENLGSAMAALVEAVGPFAPHPGASLEACYRAWEAQQGGDDAA